jgi:CBS domain-containing protein
MQVREAMGADVLTVGPAHTMAEAAVRMVARHAGSAVVVDPDQPGVGIVTERDVLRSVGAGQDPATERVADHLTAEAVFATPEWSLDQAAQAMIRGGFRHLVVMDGGQTAGMLSMRDIVRCWVERAHEVAGDRAASVREAMATSLLTVEPAETLREAAMHIAARRLGSAVVLVPGRRGPGIVTERDLLRSVAAGQDPGIETVADHHTAEVVCAAVEWSLDQAAVAMVQGGFRHLVVVDGGETVGMLSMRDVVRHRVEGNRAR